MNKNYVFEEQQLQQKAFITKTIEQSDNWNIDDRTKIDI